MSRSIAIVGGGPSALFLIKKLIEQSPDGFSVDIFEKTDCWAAGMPYSEAGSNLEHVTNVSGNEIPELIDDLTKWIKALPTETVAKFQMEPETFSDYKVLPRLLFGKFLRSQFSQYVKLAQSKGIKLSLNLETTVTDVLDLPRDGRIEITHGTEGKKSRYDKVIICIGHQWPVKQEGSLPGWFDSPYPPAKLSRLSNQCVALKGCSLTAIDAIRTLARANGRFVRDGAGTLVFKANDDCGRFRLLMYSRHAILPGLRFHLEDPHLSRKSLLSKEDYALHRKTNAGFISLDFIFQNNFVARFKTADSEFHTLIKNWSMEEFVAAAMDTFSSDDPFGLFKAEYRASLTSIRQEKSEFWKEKLAILSVAMNYPAKYLSAEDMQRFQHVLMPLISIVIAFAPQSSCEELIALHEANRIDLVCAATSPAEQVEQRSAIRLSYTDLKGNPKQELFDAHIECTGQPHLSLQDFPFASLRKEGVISQARLKFQDASQASSQIKERVSRTADGTFLDVPGLAITDEFRAVDVEGNSNPRVYIMAVPYIGGYNPDYSGLDFCDDASKAIVADLIR